MFRLHLQRAFEFATHRSIWRGASPLEERAAIHRRLYDLEFKSEAGADRNQHLVELLIKLPRDQKLISKCKEDIFEQIAILHNEKKFRSVVIVPDVDVV